MGSAAVYGVMRGDMGVAYNKAQHPSNPPYNIPSQSSPGSSSTSEDEGMCSDLGGELLGSSSSSAVFATAGTLASCAQYLEPILRDLGLKQWQLQSGDAVAAVNRLYELVQQHQQVLESREHAEDELHKAKVDARVNAKTIQRLQGQVEAKEQELGALNIKLRQLDAWYREETERWSQERVELCKKSSQLEQRHTQWQHELRRRDVEIEKLQKHLATQIASTERRRRASNSGNGGSSNTSNSSSTIVLTTAGASSGKHGRGPASSSKPCGPNTHSSSSQQPDTKRMSKAEVEELYKRSLESFEAERSSLESDNAALRKALHSLEREHKELLNSRHSAARCSGAGSSSSSDCKAAPSSSSPDPQHHLAGAADSLLEASFGHQAAAMPAAATAAAADPAAALHRMHTNLQALKVRKQRVTGGTPLSELQQQAESSHERLLLAKLQEAGRIMEEQESALALALKAISVSGGGD